jgi:hypothetical protein
MQHELVRTVKADEKTQTYLIQGLACEGFDGLEKAVAEKRHDVPLFVVREGRAKIQVLFN